MASPLTYLGAFVLVVHLLGTVVYLELAEVADFTYMTTLLGGTIDVGDTGMRVFGVLWAVGAIGFIAAAGGSSLTGSSGDCQ